MSCVPVLTDISRGKLSLGKAGRTWSVRRALPGGTGLRLFVLAVSQALIGSGKREPRAGEEPLPRSAARTVFGLPPFRSRLWRSVPSPSHPTADLPGKGDARCRSLSGRRGRLLPRFGAFGSALIGKRRRPFFAHRADLLWHGGMPLVSAGPPCRRMSHQKKLPPHSEGELFFFEGLF